MAVTSKKIKPDAKPKVVRAKKEVAPPVEVVYVSPFAVGARVNHATFGPGKVEDVVKNQLSIRFDDKSTRVILDSFVTKQNS